MRRRSSISRPPAVPPPPTSKPWGCFVVLGLLVFGLNWAAEGFRWPWTDDEDRATSLVDAIQDGNYEAVREFVARGADVNHYPHGDGHYLFHTGDRRMISLLLDLGANPNARDHEGDTLLNELARSNDAENLRKAIAKGADLEARSTTYGSTALEDAIEQDRREAIEVLRAAGAVDPTVSAHNGRPLPADGGGPLAWVRGYVAAIHAQDRGGMAIYNHGLDPNREEDWTYMADWPGAQPLVPRLIEGYANEQRATLYVCGEAPAGFVVIWGYQLERRVVEALPERPLEPAGVDDSPGIWTLGRSWWLADRPAEECPPAPAAAAEAAPSGKETVRPGDDAPR
jgi:hypothetical protein